MVAGAATFSKFHQFPSDSKFVEPHSRNFFDYCALEGELWKTQNVQSDAGQKATNLVSEPGLTTRSDSCCSDSTEVLLWSELNVGQIRSCRPRPPPVRGP